MLIFDEYYSLLDLVENFKGESKKRSLQDEEVLLHIHNYIIIRLVTILEQFFWGITKIMIDGSQSLRLKIEKEDITVKFKDLVSYGDGKITLGDIYATAYSFQKFQCIREIMNKFVEPIKEIKNYEKYIITESKNTKSNTNNPRESYLQKVKIENLFSIRHDLVHTLEHKKFEIYDLYWAIEEILIITQTMVRNKTKIVKHGDYDFKLDGITQAYVSKGLFYFIIENYDLSKKCFENATKMDSSLRTYLQIGFVLYVNEENKEAITWLDKALEIDGENVEALYYKGITLTDLGRYKEAISVLDKALEIDGEDVVVISGKAAVYAMMKEFEEAIVWFDKALEIDGEDVEALCNKGITLTDLGRYKEAISVLDKALEIDEEDVVVISNKGRSLAIMEEYVEAIVWFDKALEIDEEDVDTLYYKGITLTDLGRYKEAISVFDKALEIDEEDVDVISNKGRSLAIMEEYVEAIVWFDKALEIDEEDVDTLYYKGITLTDLGRYKEAISVFDKALEIDEEDVDVIFNKGRSLAIMEEYVEAIVWFDKALEIVPNNEITLCSKGMALVDLGCYKEAISVFDKALEIVPNSKKIIKYREFIIALQNK